MTHRARIATELPTEMRLWMEQHGTARLWDELGRVVATTVGRRLRMNDGEAGWNREVHGLLLREPSLAVRVLATQLGCDGRHAWSAKQVMRVVVEYFELYSARFAIYQRLRQREQTTHAA